MKPCIERAIEKMKSIESKLIDYSNEIKNLQFDLKIINSPELQKIYAQKEELERRSRILDRKLLRDLTSGGDYQKTHNEWKKLLAQIESLKNQLQ